MALIPAQNGGGSSGKKCCRGEFDATGSEQTVLFSNHNIEGDTDFNPRFLAVYKMFPNSSSGADASLTTGTHMNILDKVNFQGFAYRAQNSSGSVAVYRTVYETSSGGSRIYNTFNGGFTIRGNTDTGARYYYFAME